MAVPFQSNSTDLPKAMREFDERLRLARASELASFGHFQEAEKILCAAGISEASAAELDFLARIHVRQGRFEDARKRWDHAISRDGCNRAKFEECLRTLEAYAATCVKRRWIERVIALALLAALVAMTIWFSIHLLHESGTP